MINLEQIQSLNSKVQKALEVIVTLRDENVTLKGKLGNYETRIEELEVLVNSFSREQDDIESGILNILQQLDRLEEDYSSKDEITVEEKTTISQEVPDRVIPAEVEEKFQNPVETMPVSNEVVENSVIQEEPQETFEKAEPEAELDIF